jgi:hypothetical protein
MSLGGPRHGAWVWCLDRVPKHRNQWQEVEGLLFSPKNSQLVHILSFRSKGVVFLFIFPTGLTALDSEPRGRRYVKNTGHNRNSLYSRVIHCPASMCVGYYGLCKKLDFPIVSLGGRSHGTRVWCLGRVPTIGKK